MELKPFFVGFHWIQIKISDSLYNTKCTLKISYWPLCSSRDKETSTKWLLWERESLHCDYWLDRLWTLSWGINSQSAVGRGDIQFLPNGWNWFYFFCQEIYKLDIFRWIQEKKWDISFWYYNLNCDQTQTNKKTESVPILQLKCTKTRPGDLVICRTHWDNFVVNILTIFYHFRQYKSQSKLW